MLQYKLKLSYMFFSISIFLIRVGKMDCVQTCFVAVHKCCNFFNVILSFLAALQLWHSKEKADYSYPRQYQKDHDTVCCTSLKDTV